MAVGYLARSATNTDGMSLQAMLYCKTNIAGYFFDGFIDVDVSHELEVTSNPVETGAAVTDHSYVKPVEITMKIMMSDVHQSLVPGQFEGDWSRSVAAFKLLKKIQSDRIPVAVLCRLGLYENMLLKSIKAADNSDTYQALSADVTLVELPIARVKTVKLSKASQTTISTECGKYAPVDVSDTEDQSIFYMLGLGAGANQSSNSGAGGGGSGTQYYSNSTLLSSARKSLVNVAKSQIGVTEPDGDDVYIDWYNNVTAAGFSRDVSWCAIFVSWCARHAGVPKSQLPNYSSCSAGMSTAKQLQTWRSTSNYTPKLGDVIMFQKPTSRHTGIVSSYSSGYVYTIEGNAGDPGAVRTRKYKTSDKQILGYVDWDKS